jgi:hypothetical protein
MMNITPFKAPVKFKLLALATIPIMVACGGSPSVEDPEAALCEDLNALATALQGLNQLTDQSTVDELETAKADITSAYQAVQSSATAVGEARIGELETAYADYESTVNSISGDSTLGEAAATVAAASDNVTAARQQVFSSLGCP